MARQGSRSVEPPIELAIDHPGRGGETIARGDPSLSVGVNMRSQSRSPRRARRGRDIAVLSSLFITVYKRLLVYLILLKKSAAVRCPVHKHS